MARNIHKLQNTFLKASRLKPGRYSDGGGLYFKVGPTGSKAWTFIWTPKGKKKRREMGMGTYPAISLAQARKFAAQYRSDVAEGIDPIKEKKKTSAPIFSECANEYIAMKEPEWTNAKSKAQWEMTLGPTYCAAIQDKQISEIDTDDIVNILQPIWLTKAETASRLQGRLENIFDYAKTKGWYIGENPARKRGHLQHLLPKQNKVVKHMPAMPYEEVPQLMKALQGEEGITSSALQFLILTVARTNEVRFAKWDDIDFENATWTIPFERMKMKRDHVVPLSVPALEILSKVKEASLSDFIFPGTKSNKPLSEMTMLAFMRRRGIEKDTVHGFRSSFRDWAGDETDAPRDITELAMSHKVGNDAELAYRRSTALEKRRKLMEAWGAHCLANE